MKNIITNSKIIQSHIMNLNLDHIFNMELLSMLSIHSFKANEVLFKADDCVKHLYILLDGQSGVVPSSEKGRLSILDLIMPGDVIGDIEYFNNDNYYYQVIALTDCTLLAIPVSCIERYLFNNVSFFKYTSKNLAQKMKRTSFKYSRALLYPLKSRLAKYLYELSKIHGYNISNFQANHAADYLGISTRHLRRVMLEMEQQGVILRENSSITIVDIALLKKQISAT